MTSLITPTGASINSSDDLGLFTCDDPSFFNAGYPQCGNFTPPLSDAGTLIGNTASFAVTALPGNTFDFFVALNVANGPPTSVSASITGVVGTPEPRFLPLAGRRITGGARVLSPLKGGRLTSGGWLDNNGGPRGYSDSVAEYTKRLSKQ